MIIDKKKNLYFSHVNGIFLEEKVPDFPFVALTVSGGHTNIYHVLGFGEYDTMGSTLDDAAGEAFDKVAKLLDLGYPGGSVIEKIASSGRSEAINFPRAYLAKDSLDFSFSGLKTAVALYVKNWRNDKGKNEIKMADIAASFQASVIDILIDKVIAATELTMVKSVVLAGGVARNNYFRRELTKKITEKGVSLYIPKPELCTDNGAMIAVAAYHRIMKGQRDDLTIDARSRFPLNRNT